MTCINLMYGNYFLFIQSKATKLLFLKYQFSIKNFTCFISTQNTNNKLQKLYGIKKHAEILVSNNQNKHKNKIKTRQNTQYKDKVKLIFILKVITVFIKYRRYLHET